MTPITDDLESRNAVTSEATERALLTAELSWELRQIDPQRSEQLAAELAGYSPDDVDGDIGLIGEILGLYHRINRGASAAILQETERLEPLVADGVWRARLITLSGIACFTLGDYAAAIEHHLRALGLREEIGDRRGMAHSFNNLGIIRQELGDYPAAMEEYNRSLAIEREIGDDNSVSHALNNIATVHQALGDYSTALELFRRSLDIREMTGDRSGVAKSLNNIGTMHFALGDHQAALDTITLSLAIKMEMGDRAAVAASLNNIGNVHQALGDHQAALDNLWRSIAIKEEMGDQAGVANSLNNIGDVYHALGDFAAALDYSQRAAAIHRETGSRAGMVASIISIGRAQIELGDHVGAVVNLDAALDDALGLDARGMVADAHAALAAAHEQTGRHDIALRHLREHLRIIQQIQGDEMKRQMHLMEAQRRIAEVEKEAEIERLRNVELAAALRRMEEMQTRMVHSEKMAGLGQLTAGIAHEFNNPINFIVTSLAPLSRDFDDLVAIVQRLVESDPGADDAALLAELREVAADRGIEESIDEIRTLVAGIRKGAERAAEIIRDLRTFSRLDEEEQKPSLLHEGLDATLTLLGSMLGSRITVRRDYGPIPAVDCYPGQINQVFMNILSNAVDAIDGEGEIRIATEAKNGNVVVKITDTGAGIPPENLARVFDPFFTTKDVGKGTGLGLAISYGIIRDHGGDIAVRSREGEGSTFVLTLPVGMHGIIHVH